MPDEPIVKYRPADFLVRETTVPDLSDAGSEYQYLLLRKSGLTTMEAIGVLADRLGTDRREIGYGGLKDEDGVTEQLVTVRRGTAPGDVSGGGWRPLDEPGRWLVLQHYGYGDEPMRVGRIEGNAFRVVVRNLPHRFAERLAARPKVTMLFLNYYDTQRFGVPGGPKRTQFVGGALLERRWDTALRELVGLRAPESPSAQRWGGSPQGFFDQLDPRTSSFYLAAYGSHEWNRSLTGLVRAVCPEENRPVTVEGIEYHHVTSIDAAARVLGKATALPYRRFDYRDGVVTEEQSERATVVQTIMSVSPPEPDRDFEGRHSCTLRFFLPSGCYATAAVRQFLSLPEDIR